MLVGFLPGRISVLLVLTLLKVYNMSMTSNITLWTTMISIFSVFTLWKQRNRLIFHPHQEITLTPHDVGVNYVNVYIPTNEGQGFIHGWFLQPEAKPSKLVVLSHGNAGNLSNRIGFAKFWDEYLKPQGYAMFLYDYPGFGASTMPLESQRAKQVVPTVESCKNALKSVIRYFQACDSIQPT